jgi:hypothetical protein
VSGDKRKIGGAICETGAPLVAHQRGRVAQKQQIEIVVMVEGSFLSTAPCGQYFADLDQQRSS